MGLVDWITSQSKPGPDVHFGPRFGAVGTGRTDGNGVPIIEFSPQMVEALKLAEGFHNYGSVYRTSAPVRICVDFLARNIAQLGLKTYRQVDDRQVPERGHQVSKVLRRPNPRTTRFQLIRGTVSDVAIYDNAYWLKKSAGRSSDRDKLLYRIPSWAVQPKDGNWMTGPDYYRVNTGGGTADFGPDEIVHFQGYNPIDMRVGVSMLLAMQSVLNEDAEASDHRANFWRNAARQDGVIERPAEAPKWKPGARERFLTAWRNAYSGKHQAGRTGLLEDGMHFNARSFSPKDSEFIEGREFTLDTVATAYGIPLAVLSRKNTATFASMKEFRTMLYVDCFGPWNAMIEQQIWLQLLPDFEDTDELFVEFNIDEKLQGDFEGQVQALRNGVQVPYISPNIALKLLGLEPIDDPRYDLPARPQNFTYGDEEPGPAGQAQQELDDVDEDDRPELAPAASRNGHREIASADLQDLEVLRDDLKGI